MRNPGTSYARVRRAAIAGIVLIQSLLFVLAGRTAAQASEPAPGVRITVVEQSPSPNSAAASPPIITFSDALQRATANNPQAQAALTQTLQDMTSDLTGEPQPIEVKLFSQDQALLADWASKVGESIGKIKGVVDVLNGIDNTISGPAVMFQVNPSVAARAGFTPEEVATTTAAMVEGEPSPIPVVSNDHAYTLRVRFPAASRASVGSLRDTLLTSSNGRTATLGALASVTSIPGQTEIRRDNLQRQVTVSARLEGTDLGTAIAKVQSAIADLHLPPSIRVEYGGTYKEQQRSFRDLVLVLVLAIVLVFCVLLFEFGTFAAPLAILSSALLSTSGVILALLITRTTFNISSFMGMIMVIGIVAKNGILLLDADQKLTAPAAAQAAPNYAVVRTMLLGGDGGWDYVYADSGARRLYIARATRFMVVDLDSGKLVGEIPDTPGAHGVAIVSDLGIGLTTNGRENMSSVFDLKTLKVSEKIKTGEGPDAIVYDPASGHVFIMNGHGKSASVIDPKSRKVVATIALSGKPEAPVADGKGRVYVNIEDKNSIAVIDSNTNKVIAEWPMAGCDEPSGLDMDRDAGDLFAACGNKLMAIVDSKTGKLITTIPTGDGSDGLAFAPKEKVAVTSNGEGNMSFVRKRDGKYALLENVPTKKGARTIGFDASTGQFLTVSADLGPAPKPSPENPRGRPTPLPNSFVVIAVGKK